MHAFAWTEILLGRMDEAEGHLVVALELFRGHGDTRGRARCLRALGDVCRNLCRYEEATRFFRSSLELFHALGATKGVAETVHGLAEIDRLCGRLEAAEEGYKRSIRLDASIGLRQPAIAQLNLALVQVARERYVEAGDALEDVAAVFRRRNEEAFLACAYVCLLPTHAARDAWIEFDLR